MDNHLRDKQLRRIRIVVALFVVGLIASGVTAIPLKWEIDTLASMMGIAPGAAPQSLAGLDRWIALVRQGLHETDAEVPVHRVRYGLAGVRAHHDRRGVRRAPAGPGPQRVGHHVRTDRLRVRDPDGDDLRWPAGIPFNWRLIDCAFGIAGALPLGLARLWTARLAKAG